jgi:radical SAM superfamily enzyme YgiQ (UPF0313 family)
MTWRAIREARARLEKERGTVRKDWGGRTSFALAYPNSYYLGMSSLGFQTMYAYLNSHEDLVCERVFREPRRTGAEQPISLESQRPLTDFDILAFSVSYELDYLNVVRVLEAGRIPLLAGDRDESHPLVIAGGPCVTANPEPLSPFVDCFAVGEGEAILPAMLETLTEGIQGSRDELLEGLAALPGIYVPRASRGCPVRRQWVSNVDSVATHSAILTPDTELSDMFIVEIARGCGWGCRFCLAGFWFRPFRYRSLDTLLPQVEKGLVHARRIGLLAAAVSDHPEIDNLVSGLRRMGAEVSVSSLRIRPLSAAVLRGIVESGTQTVSLAPEAGSERLRQLINKCVTEDDVIKAIDTVAESGLRHIKLYFMIGLPTETDADIEEIIRLTLHAKSRVERTGCRIALTVAPFVPKAGTPFQWLAMTTADVLERRMTRIRNGLAGSGIDVRTDSVGWSLVQGALSRGDARLGAALAGMSGNSLAAWRRALEEHSLSVGDYVHRELPLDEPLPWSAVESGVATKYLREELDQARQGEQTAPCPPANCRTCGVC